MSTRGAKEKVVKYGVYVCLCVWCTCSTYSFVLAGNPYKDNTLIFVLVLQFGEVRDAVAAGRAPCGLGKE